MPGARQIVGQELGQIESVECAGLDPIVGQNASHGRLRQEKQSDHCKVESEGFLAWRHRPFVKGSFVSMLVSGSATPTEVVEFSEHKQHKP